MAPVKASGGWSRMIDGGRETLVPNVLVLDTWFADGDEWVCEGIREDGVPVVASVRDFRSRTQVGEWAARVAPLGAIRHACAATVLDTHVVDERYAVVVTRRDPGTTLKARLATGLLTPSELAELLVATLDVVGASHTVGLSAAGIRMRSALYAAKADGASQWVLTSFGLHVDEPIDVTEELREIALHSIALVGGHVGRTGLVIPPGAVTPELEWVLRRATSGPGFGSLFDMRDAVMASLGTARPSPFAVTRTSHARRPARTRPMAPSRSGSEPDLLLLDEISAR